MREVLHGVGADRAEAKLPIYCSKLQFVLLENERKPTKKKNEEKRMKNEEIQKAKKKQIKIYRKGQLLRTLSTPAPKRNSQYSESQNHYMRISSL